MLICTNGVAGVSNPLGWCKLPRARARSCTLSVRGEKKQRQDLSVFLGGVLLADLTTPHPLPLSAPCNFSASTSLQHALGSQQGASSHQIPFINYL